MAIDSAKIMGRVEGIPDTVHLSYLGNLYRADLTDPLKPSELNSLITACFTATSKPVY